MLRDDLLQLIRRLGCNAEARDFDTQNAIVVTHEQYADRSTEITVYNPYRFLFVDFDGVRIGFDQQFADVLLTTPEKVVEHLRLTFPQLSSG
jgi:hypothetical protein